MASPILKAAEIINEKISSGVVTWAENVRFSGKQYNEPVKNIPKNINAITEYFI
jgi:hypothetical protein